MFSIFNLDSEYNIPTLFTVILMIINAKLFIQIGKSAQLRCENDYLKWYMWAFVLILMGLDETCQFHERLMDFIKGNYHTTGIFYFAWTIPVIVLVLVFIVSNIGYIQKTTQSIRTTLITGGMIYLFGALGMELIGGFYVTNYSGQDFIYRILTIIEESFEIIGLIVVYNGLSRCRAR